MSTSSSKIADNLARIRARIAQVAERGGRTADDVTLVAVTKYASLDDVRALTAAGCRELAESRPQQLWNRAEALNDLSIHWHFVGHLQRNKIERTLPVASLIHSVDSPRLLEALDAAVACPPVLLEVNVSGEKAKQGFTPDELERFLAAYPGYKNIQIRGLMCMAGLVSDAAAAQREFAMLRALRDRLRPNCPPGVEMIELSMGMSRDFEIAVEEGATLVRVGTALFV
jgi:PLP dependent protein